MKIVVGITGASGSIYAQRLIKYLSESPEVEQISVVFSDNAHEIYLSETGEDIAAKKNIELKNDHDFYVPYASGSSTYDALIICPCSVGTLGRIAGGISNTLITRAADVMLKERRKLILVLRETPYNLIHIRNMETVTSCGGIILPASPSFYTNPKTIPELVDTVVFRILSLIGIQDVQKHWME